MAERSDDRGNDAVDDLVLHAVRSLPALTLDPAQDRRIAARARACFARSHRPSRWTVALLSLSLAGLSISYLFWAARAATSLVAR
jgi:hypothetical protein